ncbi:hypothetical protein C8Q74DRAFT_1367337 [Fomes fomentarius]|nr:hypothetical protein C8Q74DRAFT_1367337 [Fomes fomentarius]
MATTTGPSVRSPFDDADADIIFRSSDGVDFRLYKVIVAKASQTFRGMLTLPTDPTGAHADEKPQVVELTENARTLEHLFRLCCPVEHPTITSVDDVHAVLEAARKYEMDAVTANLRWVVKRMLPREPLRIYAIAYMLGTEDVCREAAELLLDEPQFHIPARPPVEFTTLPSLAIYAVHIYRQKCVAAALGVFRDRDWVLNGDHVRVAKRATVNTNRIDLSSSWIWVRCHHASNSASVGEHEGHRPEPVASSWAPPNRRRSSPVSQSCPLSPVGALEYSGTSYPPAMWWWTYVKSLEGVLSQRPSGRAAYADLTLFNNLLATKIDAAIAKVKIDLPFARLGGPDN